MSKRTETSFVTVSERRGRTSTLGYRLAPVMASLLLALGLIVSGAGPDARPAPVGHLGPSMVVHPLDGESTIGAVMLADLRDDVLSEVAPQGEGGGVDVALIDTGVAPVSGLDGPGKVLHGPDLSFEGSSPDVAFLDTFGHGTHMAGIIAGERPGHEGIAPDARIVSLKVAGHDGLTTVPQVVAAIDWVVEHHDRDGLNIRVLNLSLGQNGVDSHVGDHLSAAVERAWDAGIFVVVAAGNSGETQPHLDSPAIDPYVLAVGAVDSTEEEEREDRPVPAWSGHGDGARDPDIVAPGRSVASYRVPGSTIDDAAPGARHGDGLFRGSGTSQAAATASGLAAALLSLHPELTPDQVKATIERRASDLDDVSHRYQGDGHVRGRKTLKESPVTGGSPQAFPNAADAGTGVVAPTGATWAGGTWTGATWTGATWTGDGWS